MLEEKTILLMDMITQLMDSGMMLLEKIIELEGIKMVLEVILIVCGDKKIELLEMPMLLKEILIELKEMKMQFLGMQML
jgi:hypothetical protein